MYQAHINIFRSISDIESDELYDRKAVATLKQNYSDGSGVINSENNVKAMQAKNERMQDMGDDEINDPEVGQTYIEVNEHYIKLWDDKSNRLVIHLYVTAGGVTLLNVPLEDILGINFFPFESWADDVEKTDLWSDGLGDIVRTPNKILNSFFSSMIENRTLRNFGMHFYDATANEKWIPQTYEPTPFGWYPTAGNPNETTKQVEIPDLSESMDEMNFVIGMVERASSITATEKGTDTKGQNTLGEIKLMLANSNKRITSTSKFYRLARTSLGNKWYKFILANEKLLEPVALFKKSSQGNYFKEEVSPSDWKDEEGFVCKVVSKSERDQNNIEDVQKLQAVSAMMPMNAPLKKILQKKALELVTLSPDEIKEVMEFEDNNPAMLGADPATLSPTSAPAPIPAQ
jgi:hypothetical protein